jgi:hypothetical protein
VDPKRSRTPEGGLALRDAVWSTAGVHKVRKQNMAEQSVIGVYDSLSKAEEAVYKLDWAGFPIKQVSIVGQNWQREDVLAPGLVASLGC